MVVDAERTSCGSIPGRQNSVVLIELYHYSS